MKAKVVCTLERGFLEKAAANLYAFLFEFRDELVEKSFEQDGKHYRISSVEISDDKIIAYYYEPKGPADE